MKKAIIFDTETTSVDDDAEIIQAAYLELNPENIRHPLREFNEYYFPEKKNISLGAKAVHHITETFLALNTEKSCSEFVFPECEYLIGHNVDFDWRIAKSPQNVKRIDTLAMARAMWPELDSHTQSALLYFLIGDKATEILRNAHDALADVKICHQILLAIMEEKNIYKMEDLYDFSEICRIPRVMPYGKHKGLEISKLPIDYVHWLLFKSDIKDEYLKAALQKRYKE